MKSRYSDETTELCACETTRRGPSSTSECDRSGVELDVMMIRGHKYDVAVVRGDRSAAFACR
eukprot:5589496-Prymnesium_polylepis.1